MIKVPLLFSCVIALTSGAALYTNKEVTPMPCKSTANMWGSDDLTMFYLCAGGVALEFSCPPNTLFQSTEQSSGCMPIEMIDDNCVYRAEVQPCTGENLRTLQTHTDPTKFYLCPYEGADPVALSCATGRAFVKQDGYLGCFQWAEFRQIRQCQNF